MRFYGEELSPAKTNGFSGLSYVYVAASNGPLFSSSFLWRRGLQQCPNPNFSEFDSTSQCPGATNKDRELQVLAIQKKKQKHEDRELRDVGKNGNQEDGPHHTPPHFLFIGRWDRHLDYI